MTYIPFPDKKYSVIYADPPWSFKTWSAKGRGRSADKHYNTMDKKSIQELPVLDIAKDDCVLFLWVTAPCLLEGIELIKTWGFTYKTIGFTWIKRNKVSDSLFWGMGYYTRSNAEYCLIATRGKPLHRINKAVHSVVTDKIARHSQKPESVRERIELLFGDVPRMELFARKKSEGWSCWGDDENLSIDTPAE